MKKIILLLVVFLAITHIARADQGTCGANCTYELDNKGFLLIKPIDNLNKAYIQDRAFQERKDFTKVKVEEGVVSIGDNAFYETNLVKAELPNTLNSIGVYAFCNTKLRKITLPNSLTSIGEGAFASAKLKKIKIPDSVSRIGARAFSNNELREVILPKNLKVIEGGAFYDNDELVDIVIPDTVTSIECEDWYIASGAFESCDKMENVYFSKTLESIGREAFARTNIKELNLPKSLKTIGFYAFSNIKISELNIPDSVIFIDEGAFEEIKLSYLVISDTTEVAEGAFKDAKIGTVYCRGDLDVCKENLENAVPETTVFKSISELNNGAADEQVYDTANEEDVELEENTVSPDENEVVDEVETGEAEVDVSVSYSVPTSETAEDEETDDIVSYNTTTAQMVDKNILADEELMKTITPMQLKEYIARGADVNIKFTRKTKDTQDENKIIETKDVTPLMMASLGNPDKRVIEILLDNGAVINAQNENGKTAFMYAAQGNSNPEIIETLLKYGANIEAKDNDGCTPLIAATANNNSEIVKILLRHNADVNVKDNKEGTPLMFAIMYANNSEIIKDLIDAVADVNKKDYMGLTPLMLASMGTNNPEIFKTLISAGADVNITENHGLTPLMFAVLIVENTEIIKAIVDAGADVNAYIESPIQTATFIALVNPNHKIFEIFVQSDINQFCRINRSYSDDIYYCKDRLTNYMQKEHLLPSCMSNVAAMIGLSPIIQAMQYTDAGKGTYALVALAEMTSKLNCSISNTFKDLGMLQSWTEVRDKWKEASEQFKSNRK